jgi:uncharacterized damage-inducible protein DinB
MTSPAAMLDEAFVDYSCDRLKEYAERIQDCLAKLTADQVWLRGSESANSVGNLVLHLCGNVGEWISAGLGGRPLERNRDGEFAARGGPGPEDLSRRIAEAVSGALTVIRGLSASRLISAVEIQNERLTVLEAVYHVVEHFSQHTGQILFATKLLTGQDLGYYKHLSQA